jgi:tetraacyldisaccharide 4'-kinase
MSKAAQSREWGMGRLLEGAARRWWGEEARGPGWSLLSLVTMPLEWGFRLGVRGRRAGYDSGLFRSGRASVPVVSVGNLSVGGTGKTPVAGYLVRRLAEMGRRPALVARGYGEDELLLHRRWSPGVPVVADPDRVAAAARAEEGGADVLVLDDGFQHRRLSRDLDLVVLAAEQGLPGRLLPRGPFREPASALSRADHVVVTRKTSPEREAQALAGEVRRLCPGLPVARVRLGPGAWTDLAGSAASPPEGPALAVCAIGSPQTFAGLVSEALGQEPELMAFPDHHPFSRDDVASIARRRGSRAVVTTEKDAMKLGAFAELLPGTLVLPLELRFEEGEQELLAAVGRVCA